MLSGRSSGGWGVVVGTAGVAGLAGFGVVATLTARRVRQAEREQISGRAGTGVPADGIVVLGATVTPAGPCAELRVRLEHGMKLWQQGVAPVLIVSGGWDGELDEVAAMRDYLVDRGVPTAAVLEARPGDNTRLTLRSVKELGDRRYVAVSTPYHAYRIGAESRRQEIDVRVDCPRMTPETRQPRVRRARVHAEVAGVILYALPESVAARLRSAVGGLRHSVPRWLAGRPARERNGTPVVLPGA
jgi:vancomycin permeability regulator SanA